MQLIKWLLGDWWKPVTDGKTWGIYHPTAWHRWSYGLTKQQAKRECRYRNRGVTDCCKDCGYTYASHLCGRTGGIECP